MHKQGINKQYRLQAKPGFSKVVNIPKIAPKISFKQPQNQIVKQKVIKHITKASQLIVKPSNIQPKTQVKQKPQAIVSNRSVGIVKNRSSFVPPKRDRSNDNVKQLKGIGIGRILIICANGPSMSEVDFSTIKDNQKIDFYCVNKPNTNVFPSKFWGFCDQSQYNRHKELFDSYEGILINPTSVRARRHNQVLIRVKQGSGFSKDLELGYYIGRSSSYAAMQVAYYMEYSHIFLFGVDMAADQNGNLWSYGNNNPDVKSEERLRRFAAEAKSYALAGDMLTQAERNRYTFCSSLLTWPFKDRFNHIDHKVAIEKVLEYIK